MHRVRASDAVRTVAHVDSAPPRYAGDAESIKTAIAREAVFRERYAAARERWLAGDRHVDWPAGTDAMKCRHRVPCEMPD